MLSSVVVVSCRRRFLTERGEGSAVEVQFLGYPILFSKSGDSTANDCQSPTFRAGSTDRPGQDLAKGKAPRGVTNGSRTVPRSHC